MPITRKNSWNISLRQKDVIHGKTPRGWVTTWTRPAHARCQLHSCCLHHFPRSFSSWSYITAYIKSKTVYIQQRKVGNMEWGLFETRRPYVQHPVKRLCYYTVRNLRSSKLETRECITLPSRLSFFAYWQEISSCASGFWCTSAEASLRHHDVWHFLISNIETIGPFSLNFS